MGWMKDGDPQASLEVVSVRFRYAEQEPYVLDNVSLRVEPGESVAIVGPSGGGKSTLMSVMLGLLPPTEGEVRVGGQSVAKAGLDTLREMVGAVLQDDVLFAGTLAENISFFDPGADPQWIVECARTAALHQDIEGMPMRYNTMVGDMGTVLSGGQKQRVLLARALYKRPKILFLDEATSHLDVELESVVNAAVKSLQMTRIIVAHRPQTIASVDRVVVLAGGRLIEHVKPRDIAAVRAAVTPPLSHDAPGGPPPLTSRAG
jgi:ATP-binding cassette subfamily B protein RaxB